MPTASEYKHEPYGIPCHCYVKRRINRSLGRKSCLRQSTALQQQNFAGKHSKVPTKTVTFDSVLRIRRYHSNIWCDDYKKPLYSRVDSEPASNCQDDLQSIGAVQAQAVDSFSSVVERPLTNFDWSLCDKIASFLGFQKISSSSRGARSSGHRKRCAVSRDASISSITKPLLPVDENNETVTLLATSPVNMDYDQKQKSDKQQICGSGGGCLTSSSCWSVCHPYKQAPPCQVQLNKQQSSGGLSWSHESVLGGGNSRVSSSSLPSKEYDNVASARKPIDYCSSSTSSSQHNGNRSNYQLENIAAISTATTTLPYQVSGQDFGRLSVSSGCSESDSCSPDYDEFNPMPLMSMFQGLPVPSLLTKDDKSTEGAPLTAQLSHKNRGNEHMYTPVKLSLHQHTNSENFDSWPVAGTLKGSCDRAGGNMYGYGSSSDFIKHKSEKDLSDLSADTSGPERCHLREDMRMTPKLSSDLQGVTSRPYDIEFLNESVTISDSKLKVDISAKIQTIEKTKRALLNRCSTVAGCKSLIVDAIFKMIPAASFWTGCAFLIALIYIILFSCA